MLPITVLGLVMDTRRLIGRARQRRFLQERRSLPLGVYCGALREAENACVVLLTAADSVFPPQHSNLPFRIAGINDVSAKIAWSRVHFRGRCSSTQSKRRKRNDERREYADRTRVSDFSCCEGSCRRCRNGSAAHRRRRRSAEVSRVRSAHMPPATYVTPADRPEDGRRTV